MSYPRPSCSSASSTEVLLPPSKPQQDYYSTVASMQNGIGIMGQSPLVPNPASSKPASEKSHFWSRKEKSQPIESKPLPSQHEQQPKQPDVKQMSREEALVLLMDKYGMTSVQLGGRSGRM